MAANAHLIGLNVALSLHIESLLRLLVVVAILSTNSRITEKSIIDEFYTVAAW